MACEIDDGDNLPLKCFQHCKNTDLVCFVLPKLCPLCKDCIATTENRIPPYILPSPFTSSDKCPRSIVLKPTEGSFVKSLLRTCNLHIGVADKNGYIYDFDESGLKYGSPWSECVSVTFDLPPLSNIWDSALSRAITNPELWGPERYNEENRNCFDFVLHFLMFLATSSENHRHFLDITKTDFTDHYLVRKNKRAEQYVHLYRRTIASACVVLDTCR